MSGPGIEPTTSVQQPGHFTTRLPRRTKFQLGNWPDVLQSQNLPSSCKLQPLSLILRFTRAWLRIQIRNLAAMAMPFPHNYILYWIEQITWSNLIGTLHPTLSSRRLFFLVWLKSDIKDSWGCLSPELFLPEPKMDFYFVSVNALIKIELPNSFVSLLDKHCIPLSKWERLTGESEFVTGLSLPELDHAVHIAGVSCPLLAGVGQALPSPNSYGAWGFTSGAIETFGDKNV